MRIRKNMKLSSLLFPNAAASSGGCDGSSSSGERPQTHVCHLNQSPWDVNPISLSATHQDTTSSWFLPSSSSSSPHLHQFDRREDSYNGNGSLGDPMGAVESVAWMEKLDFMAVDDNEKSGEEELAPERRNKGKKSKTDGLNSSLKSCKKSGAVAAVTTPRRGRPKGGKKPATSASNPYEFYYYSGFGPRWGKRRGGGGGGNVGSKDGADEGNVIVGDSGSNDITNKTNGSRDDDENKTASFGNDDGMNGGGLDYMDDEDEDDEEEMDGDSSGSNNKMKKRARKPVKARSLKSLM